MIKFFLFLLLSTVSQFSFSQSHTPGTFNFSLGYDAGGHGVLYDSNFDNGLVNIDQPQDSSFATSSMFRFDGHFNLFKFLSLGLQYRGGKYIEDPDNTQAVGNNLRIYAISARFYAINKDRFALYLGSSFGGANLIMNRQITFIVNVPYSYKFNGTHFGLEAGFNWFISKNVGLNFGVGYAAQKFNMKEYVFNNEKQDLSNYTNILKSKGITGNIALTFKLGGN